MSKPIRIILIIALVFLCLGLVMSAVFLPGALRKGVFGNHDYKGYHFGENLPSQQMDLTGVNTIRMDIDYSKVDIISTNGDKVIADVSYSGKQRFDFSMNKVGDVLVIKHVWDNQRGFWLNQDKSKIAIQVPSSFEGNYEYKLNAIDFEAKAIKADKVNVEVNAGRAIFEDLVCGSINSDLNAGDINFIRTNTNDLKIQNDAGRTVFNGKAGSVDSVINMGNMDLNFSSLPTNFKANINAGNMNVGLPSDSIFEVWSNVNAGTLNNEFRDKFSAGVMSKEGGDVQAGNVPVFKVEVNAGGVNFYKN